MMKSNALGFGLAGLIFADLAGLPEAMLAFTVPNLVTAIVLWIILRKGGADLGWQIPKPQQKYSQPESSQEGDKTPPTMPASVKNYPEIALRIIS